MKLNKKRFIIRIVIFSIFVFWVIGFPKIVPYTYPGDQYHWTYIQDSWDLFYLVFLYPPAYLISVGLCAWFRYKPAVLWMIPDILVCLPEFYERAEWVNGFRPNTFILNIVLHLLMWCIGMLLVYALRRLIARIRTLLRNNREAYRAYKQKIGEK